MVAAVVVKMACAAPAETITPMALLVSATMGNELKLDAQSAPNVAPVKRASMDSVVLAPGKNGNVRFKMD